MENSKKVKCGNNTLIGIILGIIFIVLQLIGLIEWSWVWVGVCFVLDWSYYYNIIAHYWYNRKSYRLLRSQ